MNKRGPDDCEDGGERGERGRRGHRGHRGRDGRDGDTGPTGPASSSDGFTGPTGATGPGGFTGATGPSGEGSQGLAAYGYAAGILEYEFGQGIDVQFDQGGLVFPNLGLMPPAPNGTAFTILTTGDYEYEFYFSGQTNTGNASVDLGIFVKGVSAGTAHTFRSNFDSPGSANDELVCRGEGIIHLVAGDLVTLHFVAPAKGIAPATAVGGDATANRTLSLKKLSP